jgi:hypothetical protein
LAHQDVLEDVGAVGDETVDPELDQLEHLLLVVHGPHVDVGAGRVRPAQELRGHDRDGAAVVRHLQRGHAAAGGETDGPPRGRADEERDLDRGGRGRDPAPAGAAEGLETPLGERADTDPVVGAGAVDQRGQGRRGPRRLEVDVEAGVGQLLEQVGHPRHGVGSGHPHLGELVGAQVRQPAGAVGEPVQPGVVEGQQRAVGGHVHVGLEVAVAQVEGVPEGVQRVLRAQQVGVQGATAVRHREQPVPSLARLVEHGVEVGEAGAWRCGGAHSSSISVHDLIVRAETRGHIRAATQAGRRPPR